MYHYLTGAASWFMLTMITEAFGVRGQAGDLMLNPKLMGEQFDASGIAELTLTFAGRPLTIRYQNTAHKDYGAYVLKQAKCGTQSWKPNAAGCIILPRTWVEHLPPEGDLITVDLV